MPWEEGLEAAYEPTIAKYTELVAECRESRWNAGTYPVEVVTSGFVSNSMTHLLRDVGLWGARLSRATKELSGEAEKASQWLWLR